MTTLVHGHADPDVTPAIIVQVEKRNSFYDPTKPEAALARLLVEHVPSVEKDHFRGSSTAVAITTVKPARAFTAWSANAKPGGKNHGYCADVLMITASAEGIRGTSDASGSLRTSGGISATPANDAAVLPFNDPAGAQGRYYGQPGHSTFDKIIGGGLHIRAVIGRNDIMPLFDSSCVGNTAISGGDYGGNPLATLTGDSTFGKFIFAVFANLDTMGKPIRDAGNAILHTAAEAVQVLEGGSRVQLVTTDQPSVNDRSMSRDAGIDTWLDKLHRSLFVTGMTLPYCGLSCGSSAIGPADVDECLASFQQAVMGLKA